MRRGGGGPARPQSSPRSFGPSCVAGSANQRWWPGSFGTRTPATPPNESPYLPAEVIGLGGGSDAEVGPWTWLVVAPVVLDQPGVLGGRVIKDPEGIARGAHPGLRFPPPAQVPVPLGCLLDGQLGQRERLQPLVGNGSTGQDRGPVGAGRQAGLGPFQGGPPVIQPLAQGLAGLLGDPAVGAVRLVLWAGGGDRVVVVAGHCPTQLLESATLLVQQGSRPRLVHRAPYQRLGQRIACSLSSVPQAIMAA